MKLAFLFLRVPGGLARKSKWFIWWSLVVAAAVLVKGFYSGASEQDLQWMLGPLAALTRFISGLEFNLNTAGEWVNAQNNIAIVRSCAGLNFMVLSLLAAGMRFEPKIKPDRFSLRLTFVVNLVSCLMLAFFMTLVVNTGRIILSIYLYRHEVTFLGFSFEQVHRLTGIVIYFFALWMQIFLIGRVKISRAGMFAAVLYLGLVIVVPLVTGNYKINPALFIEHVYFTCGSLLIIISMFIVGQYLLRPGQE